MKERKCEDCEIECEPDCFNKHEGSMIAMTKMMKKMELEKGIKIHITK